MKIIHFSKYLRHIFTGIVFFVFGYSILFNFGCTRKWTKAELSDLDSRHLWSHTFPEKVVYLSITQGGVVEIITAEKQGKQLKGEAEKCLLDAGSGNIIWNGGILSGALLADGENPVIIEYEEETFDLRAISRSGNNVWQKRFNEKYLYGRPDQNANCLFIFSTNFSSLNNDETEYNVKKIDLKSGEVLWHAQLESKIDLSHQIGIPMLAIGQSAIYLMFRNIIACMDSSSGRLIWEKEFKEALKSEKPFPILWWHYLDTTQAAIDNRLICFSKRRSILWDIIIHESGTVHDLIHTHEGIIVGYHTIKGAGVILYDSNNGNEKWRYEYIDDSLKKGIFANSLNGIVLSGDSIWFATANHLICLNKQSGQVVHNIEINPKKFVDYTTLISHQNNLILKGLHHVESRRADNGTIVWDHGPFLTPLEVISDVNEKAISKPRGFKAENPEMARDYLIARAIQNQYLWVSTLWNQLLNPNMYPGLFSGAAGAQMWMTQFGITMAFTGKALAFALTLSDIIIEDSQPPLKYIWFVECAHKTKMEINLSSHAYLVLIDINNGNIEKIPLLASKIEPVKALVDQIGERVAEVYVTLGLLAKKGVDLDMLKLK